MRPDLTAPNCPGCGLLGRLVPRQTRFRRGSRLLPFEGWIWECTAGCKDLADEGIPFRFSTLSLMEWEEARVAQAWQERFGEPMPPSKRPRRSTRQRTVRVPVLLTTTEAERLDAIRGDLTRSEFLRRALHDEDKKAG